MRMSRIFRSAAVLVSAATMLASPGLRALAEPDPDRLEQIEAEIEQKQEQIEVAEQRSENIEDQLSEAGERRDVLAEQVDLLAADLAAAETNLAETQDRLDAARIALHRWTDRLERARERAETQQALLDDRAAAAYRLGPGAFIDALLGAEDFGDLAQRIEFVDSVLSLDADILHGLEVARTMVARHQDRVDAYEARVATQWERVQAEVDRIAEMKSEQESLLAQVDLEIVVQEETLSNLESARERYEDAVAELETASARIRGLLQSGGSSGSGEVGGVFFFPTSGPIVSGFGWRTHPIYGTPRFHSGVDIDGACGQPIYAAEDGTVVQAAYDSGYGNATIVDHGDGVATLYAHQTSFAVSSGQQVSRGETIGYVGTTGLSTGCHLHFEVRVNGEPVDPVPYLT
jgi:murein DD-endopeptidase MepM/ murein hydrolase activator NlpD